jgi:hypothetical protein
MTQTNTNDKKVLIVFFSRDGQNWGRSGVTFIKPEFADLFYAYGVLDSGRFIGESSHLVGLGSNQASFYLRA